MDVWKVGRQRVNNRHLGRASGGKMARPGAVRRYDRETLLQFLEGAGLTPPTWTAFPTPCPCCALCPPCSRRAQSRYLALQPRRPPHRTPLIATDREHR